MAIFQLEKAPNPNLSRERQLYSGRVFYKRIRPKVKQ